MFAAKYFKIIFAFYRTQNINNSFIYIRHYETKTIHLNNNQLTCEF